MLNRQNSPSVIPVLGCGNGIPGVSWLARLEKSVNFSTMKRPVSVTKVESDDTQSQPLDPTHTRNPRESSVGRVLPSIHDALGSVSSTQKTVMVAHACHSSTQDAK